MTLGVVAQKALTAFSDVLGELGVEVPERRYVACGNLVPWDGEQLVVVLMEHRQGQPGRPFAESFIPGTENFTAQFAVAIVREVVALGEGPETIPSMDDLNAAGISAMNDAQALLKAGVKVHASQVLTGLGLGFALGPCAPVGPEGGLAGHRLLFEVSL